MDNKKLKTTNTKKKSIYSNFRFIIPKEKLNRTMIKNILKYRHFLKKDKNFEFIKLRKRKIIYNVLKKNKFTIYSNIKKSRVNYNEEFTISEATKNFHLIFSKSSTNIRKNLSNDNYKNTNNTICFFENSKNFQNNHFSNLYEDKDFMYKYSKDNKQTVTKNCNVNLKNNLKHLKYFNKNVPSNTTNKFFNIKEKNTKNFAKLKHNNLKSKSNKGILIK